MKEETGRGILYGLFFYLALVIFCLCLFGGEAGYYIGTIILSLMVATFQMFARAEKISPFWRRISALLPTIQFGLILVAWIIGYFFYGWSGISIIVACAIYALIRVLYFERNIASCWYYGPR